MTNYTITIIGSADDVVAVRAATQALADAMREHGQVASATLVTTQHENLADTPLEESPAVMASYAAILESLSVKRQREADAEVGRREREAKDREREELERRAAKELDRQDVEEHEDELQARRDAVEIAQIEDLDRR